LSLFNSDIFGTTGTSIKEMQKTVKKSSCFLLKTSSFMLNAIFGCVGIAFVVAALYQAAAGNASLSEVNRNVNLPDASIKGVEINSNISLLTFQEIQINYHSLNDEQWKNYTAGILGSRVRWSGTVTDMDNRRVEVDMGSAPLQYLHFIDLIEEGKANINIGDTLTFEGRIQCFHLMKGMNIIADYAIVSKP
jgi:hypothetical protein